MIVGCTTAFERRDQNLGLFNSMEGQTSDRQMALLGRQVLKLTTTYLDTDCSYYSLTLLASPLEGTGRLLAVQLSFRIGLSRGLPCLRG